LIIRRDPHNSAAVNAEIRRQIDSRVPDAHRVVLTPMASLVQPQLYPWRLGGALFSVLGAIGLVIASFGQYSMLSHSFAQRTRELGIRSALGANRHDLIRCLAHTNVVGFAAGIAVAFGLLIVFGQRFASLLYGTRPSDPLVFGAALLLLLFTGVLAGVLPVLRASGVNPAAVMRTE
jgi:ABC-type antimicrobial peptide transport system permease subunit